MNSQLKIIVDYPCDIYCDYDCKGQAQPNSIFPIELRKGTYFLEFKINDIVQYSIDYTIESNEQDYLLRVLLLSHIRFSIMDLDVQSKTKRDNDQHLKFCGKVYVKLNKNDNDHNIKYDSYDQKFLKTIKPFRFYIICEELTDYYYEEEKLNRLELPVEFKNEDYPQNVLIDVEWLHHHYGEYYGKIAVYMGSTIIIYYIESSKISDIQNINAEAGSLYNIAKHYALTIKNNKFGIFDLDNNRILCPHKYDDLYIEDVEYHGNTYHGFFATDKYTVVLNGRKGIVNENGEQLIPCIHDEINPCALGYIVKKGPLWAITDHGEEPEVWYDDIFTTIQTSYGVGKYHFGGCSKEEIESNDYPCSCIIYFKKGEKYGFWDVCGLQSKFLYDEIETDYLFGTNLSRLIKIRIGDKVGFIDCYGQEIIPCKYETVYIARKDNPDLALYCDYKLYTEKKIKTKFLEQNIKDASYNVSYNSNVSLSQLLVNQLRYHDTRYIAKINGKFGVCTIEGKQLISFGYEFIDGLRYDNFLVERQGLFGIIKSDKEIVLPIKYTDKEELINEFDWKCI